MTFQTSVGTYLDSPYHRYKDKRDISQLKLEELIKPGVVLDARGRKPFEEVGLDVLGEHPDLEGKAILFNFGWDKYWGKETYQSYPYISVKLIEK